MISVLNSRTSRAWATALVFLMVASCSEKDGDDVPSQNTPNYLLQAIDPDMFFRWTPEQGESSIVVPILVKDVNPALSAEDRDEFEAWIVEARDKWKLALIEGGTPIDTITRFQSKGQSFPSGTAMIAISFGDHFVDSSKSGAVLHWAQPSDPSKVLAMGMGLVMKNGLTGDTLTDEQRRATVLHEFGHALGIYNPGSSEAHSPNEGDVMAKSAWQWSTLSTGDRAAISTLYQMTPQLVRADG